MGYANIVVSLLYVEKEINAYEVLYRNNLRLDNGFGGNDNESFWKKFS